MQQCRLRFPAEVQPLGAVRSCSELFGAVRSCTELDQVWPKLSRHSHFSHPNITFLHSYKIDSLIIPKIKKEEQSNIITSATPKEGVQCFSQFRSVEIGSVMEGSLSS